MKTNNDSLIGTILQNKYRIEKLIAQGGQGEIYLATDISAQIDRQYIVKRFVPNYDDDYKLKVGKRLFDLESATLQKLGRHSQIPQIFDRFEADRCFYLIQELIEGENLKQEFARKKQLTELQLILILKDILDVLQFVHQHCCIHRDIKPSNLIRNKHDRKIYLIDFGTVKEKIKPENIDSKGQSKITIVAGTKGYMPLEQIAGFPKFASDIYAVGMVAINALTGVEPTNLSNDNKNNPLWRDRLPVEVEKYNPNLLKIIDKMVRANWQQRYQSVKEILSDWDKLDHTVINPDRVDNNREADKNTVVDPQNQKNHKRSFFSWLAAGTGTIALAIAAFGLITS